LTGADRVLLDVVWRHGRISMLFSPRWAHVVGVDMSPTARLVRRMELDLVRCHQQALMRRAAPLPSRIELPIRARITCVVHGHAARTRKEPVQ
jgi:hypothetical protein